MTKYETRTHNTLVKRTNNFLTKVQLLYHNQSFDYSMVIYVNVHTPVIVGCPLHGYFNKTPKDLLDGIGCPTCGRSKQGWNVRGTKQSRQNKFIEKSNNKHAHKYDYSKVQYHDGKTKVEIICPRHGSFFQSPDSHMNTGLGCSKCKSSRGEGLVRWWLMKHNISFHEQYSFVGCKFKKPLKFDFYIPTHNLLIECNGRQHYEHTPIFHETNSWCTFELQQHRDDIKKQWATSQRITLITIPYYEYDSIWNILFQLFPQQIN